MLTFTNRLTRPADPKSALTLVLDHEQRRHARLRFILPDGMPVGIVLPQGSYLHAGDWLATEDGQAALVQAAEEDLSVARTKDLQLLARAAYHLGNRHAALQLDLDCLCYPRDPLLDRLCASLGLSVTWEIRPFHPRSYRAFAFGTDKRALMNEPADPTLGNAGAFTALLGMLRLGSAALPIGAYAYSQGLESAIASGVLTEGAAIEQWLVGVLEHSVLTSDVPLLVRLHAAWANTNHHALCYWNEYWRAMRATRELREEDRQLSVSLLRLLKRQGFKQAESCAAEVPRPCLGCAFALASIAWGIGTREMAAAYCFSWCEAQVGAATRILPLGQSEAQGVLGTLLQRAAFGLDASLRLRETEITSTIPGQIMFCTWHESLYTRLFRS